MVPDPLRGPASLDARHPAAGSPVPRQGGQDLELRGGRLQTAAADAGAVVLHHARPAFRCRHRHLGFQRGGLGESEPPRRGIALDAEHQADDAARRPGDARALGRADGARLLVAQSRPGRANLVRARREVPERAVQRPASDLCDLLVATLRGQVDSFRCRGSQPRERASHIPAAHRRPRDTGRGRRPDLSPDGVDLGGIRPGHERPVGAAGRAFLRRASAESVPSDPARLHRRGAARGDRQGPLPRGSRGRLPAARGTAPRAGQSRRLGAGYRKVFDSERSAISGAGGRSCSRCRGRRSR